MGIFGQTKKEKQALIDEENYAINTVTQALLEKNFKVNWIKYEKPYHNWYDQSDIFYSLLDYPYYKFKLSLRSFIKDDLDGLSFADKVKIHTDECIKEKKERERIEEFLKQTSTPEGLTEFIKSIK